MPDQPIRHTKGELNIILANLLRDYKWRDFVLSWIHQKDLPDALGRKQKPAINISGFLFVYLIKRLYKFDPSYLINIKGADCARVIRCPHSAIAAPWKAKATKDISIAATRLYIPYTRVLRT